MVVVEMDAYQKGAEMKCAGKCNAPTKTAVPHASIRIGSIVLERCDRDVLPGMVVCEFHANPDAVRMLVTDLYARLARLEGRK